MFRVLGFKVIRFRDFSGCCHLLGEFNEHSRNPGPLDEHLGPKPYSVSLLQSLNIEIAGCLAFIDLRG